MVGGLGLNASATKAAIERLPPEITLSFVAYSDGLQGWIDMARANGHEVLLEAPMEPLDDAALRELMEETGVRTVRFLAATDGWITYDFPEEVLASGRGRGFVGQKQVWYAFRFGGEDAEIQLEAHHDIEFDQWRWAPLDAALESVAPFKRHAYERVIAAFRHLAVPAD